MVLPTKYDTKSSLFAQQEVEYFFVFYYQIRINAKLELGLSF